MSDEIARKLLRTLTSVEKVPAGVGTAAVEEARSGLKQEQQVETLKRLVNEAGFAVRLTDEKWKSRLAEIVERMRKVLEEA